MRALLSVLLLLATTHALAAVRLADADPAPGSIDVIDDNQVSLTFGEAVEPIEIVVIDAKGRIVSLGKTAGTNYDIDVPMKAPDVSGYVCGPMTVRWRVRVLSDGRLENGEYSFTIRPHHGNVCEGHKH